MICPVTPKLDPGNRACLPRVCMPSCRVVNYPVDPNHRGGGGDGTPPPVIEKVLHLVCDTPMLGVNITGKTTSLYRTNDIITNQRYYCRRFTAQLDVAQDYTITLSNATISAYIVVSRDFSHKWAAFGNSLTFTITNVLTGPVTVEVTTADVYQMGSFDIKLVCSIPVTLTDLYFPMTSLTDRTPEIVGPYTLRDLVGVGTVINDGPITKAIRFGPSIQQVARTWTFPVGGGNPISSFRCVRFWLRYNGTTTFSASIFLTGSSLLMYLNLHQPVYQPDPDDPDIHLPIQADYELWLGTSEFGSTHKYPTLLTKDVWHHIVWYYDSTNHIIGLFVDAVLDTYSFNFGTPPFQGTFRCGNGQFSSTAPVDMAELSIYGSHILTQAEVTSDFNQRLTWPWT